MKSKLWNGGFLQWNGDPMGRDAKDWVSQSHAQRCSHCRRWGRG